MADWTSTMQQTFEFYVVDPTSWKDVNRLTNVKTCSIDRDSETETLGSATFDVTESVGECYIRVYLITIQNGVTERHPLGTFLVQTPSSKFDGRSRTVSMDAYTPLLELKETQPPIGYYIPKGADAMEWVYKLSDEHMRAPVGQPILPSTALSQDFVSDTNDTWLSFLSDLLTAAFTSTAYIVEFDDGVYTKTLKSVRPEDGTELTGVKTASGEQVYSGTSELGESVYYCIKENLTQYKFEIDELGRIQFSPKQETAALNPVWEYTDDNSSILHPSISMDHDLFGVPNVVEVIYSDGKVYYESTVENNDPNSPVSIPARGRRILRRVANPELYGTPTQKRLDEYAEKLLDELSSVEYTVSYTHGYCPVRVGDCVLLNYTRAGLTNVKAKVIRQSIKCVPGCPVSETAVFTAKLRG